MSMPQIIESSMPVVPIFDHPMNKIRDPLDHWDDDNLFRGYLARIKDPAPRPEHETLQVCKARAVLMKMRIRELGKLRAKLAPKRQSTEINQEIAGLLFRRKILVWLLFDINELPQEIIIHIFRFVVWSSPGTTEAVHNRLRLTWTCRLWRQLAIADQTLWNSVWFREQPPWNRSLAFLERAGTCALDVRIDDLERKDPMADGPHLTVEQIDHLMDALLQKVSQIRILVIVLHNRQSAYRVMQRFGNIAVPTSMERFEIHRTGQPFLWDQPNDEPSVALAGGHLPNLRWLCLDGLSVNWYKVPLSNLRTIDLRRLSNEVSPTPQLWRHMLRNTPMLFKLALDGGGPQRIPNVEDIPPVHLPSLRDLLIGDVGLEHAKYLLSFFDAPEIASLALINLQADDFGPLFDTLHGRFRKIRMVSMYSVRIDPNLLNIVRVIRWLDTLPLLEFLKVSQGRQPFLDALFQDPSYYRESHAQNRAQGPAAAPQTPEVICPKLKTFHFQHCDPQVIIRLLKERQRLGVPFTKVYLPAAHLAALGEKVINALRAIAPSLQTTAAMSMTPEEVAIYHEMERSVQFQVK